MNEPAGGPEPAPLRSILDVKRLLSQAVVASLGQMSEERGTGQPPEELLEKASLIEVPRDPSFGDFATSAALITAAHFRQPPRAVAQALAGRVAAHAAGLGITGVEVAGPGFVNFRLSDDWLLRAACSILADGPEAGLPRFGEGRRVQIEFVSANPVGPMNVVNARAAAVGDTLARLLQAVGFSVSKEYYVNDAGRQARLFAESVAVRMAEALGESRPFPEEGYHGEYVTDLARELLQSHPELYGMSHDERVETLFTVAVDRMLEVQREDLEAFRVRFDVWFRERSLHEQGLVEAALAELRRRGHLYEAEGARWFRSTAFGDDKDRVVVKHDGGLTYLAGDIAYHWTKYRRGFEHVIDIWGPDHHGYVARMKAAVEALGYRGEQLEVIILQLVTLTRGGKAVRMSKRAGEFVTMRELLDEVGPDAARYFFLSRSPESPLEVDLDLARMQSVENPVYYVQYAHARIASVFRQAEAEGVELPTQASIDALRPLSSPHERAVLKVLARYAEEVRDAAARREPQRIVGTVFELASAFHSFYNEHRLLDPDPGVRTARLLLARAVQRVLANGLEFLGISAPERM